MKNCKPDAGCIDCADLAICQVCEAWLLGSVSPVVTIEIDRQKTKKRFYFFRGEESLGMIEILTGSKK